MKRKSFYLALMLVAGMGILLLFRFVTPEDTWLCQDGRWVKHGSPSQEMPIKPCR